MITVSYSRKSAGKSTLIAQLASKLANSGSRVAVVDADDQGTVGNWGVYRKEQEGAKPITFISTTIHSDLEFIAAELSKTHDHVLIDLQGTDSKEHRKTLMMADKLIIPFKPTQPDLDNIPYISSMLTGLKELKPEIETYIVINEAPNSRGKLTEVDGARLYFKQFEMKPTSSVIYSRKAYRDSMSKGLGVCELKDKKAIAEIEGLWTEIYKKAIKRTSNRRPMDVHKKKA